MITSIVLPKCNTCRFLEFPGRAAGFAIPHLFFLSQTLPIINTGRRGSLELGGDELMTLLLQSAAGKSHPLDAGWLGSLG